jgi:hypothetical protein
MGTTEGRDHMLKRHEIVVRIIDANSRALRFTNEINGLDIQRLDAERQLQQNASAQGVRETLVDIEHRMKNLDEQRRKLAVEKEWLEETLASFDEPATGSLLSKTSKF